jgi:hypothetical protein
MRVPLIPQVCSLFLVLLGCVCVVMFQLGFGVVAMALGAVLFGTWRLSNVQQCRPYALCAAVAIAMFGMLGNVSSVTRIVSQPNVVARDSGSIYVFSAITSVVSLLLATVAIRHSLEHFRSYRS